VPCIMRNTRMVGSGRISRGRNHLASAILQGADSNASLELIENGKQLATSEDNDVNDLGKLVALPSPRVSFVT
jgi:hypothetical protein